MCVCERDTLPAGPLGGTARGLRLQDRRSYMEKDFQLEKFLVMKFTTRIGSISLVKIVLCSKHHCQKTLN